MYNILINNLSLVVPSASVSKYFLNVEDSEQLPMQERKFSGLYTNEPVMHALFRKFANEEKGERLNHILSLATDKVLKWHIFKEREKADGEDEKKLSFTAEYLQLDKEIVRGMTHYEFYRSLVRKLVADEFVLDSEQEIANYMPVMDSERIPNIPEASDIHNAVLTLAEKIIEIYRNHPEGCCLYLDYTGGDRSASTITIALTKMLEERGIFVDHIWAVNYDRSAEFSEIREKIEVNYIFDFISGLQEFLNYGRANMLDAFLEKSEKKGSVRLSDEAKNVQEKIRTLADEIQLCRSAKIVEGIAQLVKAIRSYEQNDTIHDPVFDYLIGDIRNNYIQFYEPAQRTIPNIIRWCLDKNLIQQAVTMYAELLPEYLVKQKILFYDRTGWCAEHKGFFLYPNEVQNYIQNGSCDTDALREKGKAIKSNYRNYKDSYAYLNYYLWEEIAERAGYVYDNKQTAQERCREKAKQIARYAMSASSAFVQVKKGVSQNQLRELLINYMLFKITIRHALNHATPKQIKVRELRDNMVWKDDGIFDGEDLNSDLTVRLLVVMMRDLLRQVVEIGSEPGKKI